MINQLRVYLTLFVCLCISSIAMGQKVQVLDEDGEPISLVEVYVFEGSRDIQYISDYNGIIQINQESFDSVAFSAQGYEIKILLPQELEQENYRIVLELLPHMFKPVNFRLNPDFESQKDLTTKVVSMKAKSFSFKTPQTTADIIGLSNQVYVQKSQMGGGSPMIRGFAANNVLIVVDGIRMNNAIFRDGNLQNVITIDPFLVDETQISFGPGSVFYGSDAMGGVMAFETKVPKIDTGGYYEGNVSLKAASANRENTWHVDLSYGEGKFAGLSSITLSNFGELKMGSNGPDEYLRTTFSEFNGQTDSIIFNDDPEIQYFTSYSQININQKLRYQVRANQDVILHYGYATSSPVPRYDRLIQTRNGLPRFGDWYYGPQKWTQLNARYQIRNDSSKWADKVNIIIGKQWFEESRFSRRFRSFDLEETTEKVDLTSLNIDLDKKWEKFDLQYGIELIHNAVESKGQNIRVDSGFVSEIPSRYPDNSKMASYAVYSSLKWHPTQRIMVNAGGRYTGNQLYAPFEDHALSGILPFNEINLNNSAVNYSGGIRYLINSKSFIYGSIATGFRAPNIDDIGKVFDSQPDRVIVPNAGLKPESSITYEIGTNLTLFDDVEILVNGYHTVVSDIVVRQDFSIGGVDSIFYNGEMMRTQALVNGESGTISGIEAQMRWIISPEWNVESAYNWMQGETADGQAIRHIVPNFGNTKLNFRYKSFRATLYANYHAKLRSDRMAPSEQSKPHLYLQNSDGNLYSPSWYTLNLKTRYTVNKSLHINLGMENILDARYRPYSSGIAAPGRNLTLSLNGQF